MGTKGKPLFNFSADDVTKASPAEGMFPAGSRTPAPDNQTRYEMHPVQKERVALATALSQAVHAEGFVQDGSTNWRYRHTPVETLLNPIQGRKHLYPFREQLNKLTGRETAELLHAVDQMHAATGPHNMEDLHYELQRLPKRTAGTGESGVGGWEHLSKIANTIPQPPAHETASVRRGARALLLSPFVDAYHLRRQLPTRPSEGGESSVVAKGRKQ